MENIYQTINEIRHRIEGVQTFVGNRFKGMLQGVIDLLNRLVEQLEELEERNKK